MSKVLKQCFRSGGNKPRIFRLLVLGTFFYYPNIFKWCFVLKFPHLALTPHEMAVCKASTVELGGKVGGKEISCSWALMLDWDNVFSPL